MLYRKRSPSPPRLLLRIVAPAGALVSIIACSSSPPTTELGGVHGSAINPNEDDDGGTPSMVGASSSGSLPSSGGVVGEPPDEDGDAPVIVGTSSGGSSTSGGNGSLEYPPDDAGPGGGLYDANGVVVYPDGAADAPVEAEGPCDGQVCGLVIGIVIERDGSGD